MSSIGFTTRQFVEALDYIASAGKFDMPKPKNDFKHGSASVAEFFYYMKERHRIWERRQRGESGPWTEDTILQTWKFTNVYRQLDRGTVALREMLATAASATDADRVFNVWWYRLLNRAEHADNLGFTPLAKAQNVIDYMRQCEKDDIKLFTGAYMTTGVSGESKCETYVRAVQDAIDNSEEVVEFCRGDRTLQGICDQLTNCYMVGKFGAYEIACDLRFLPGLWTSIDLACDPVGPTSICGVPRSPVALGEPTTACQLRCAARRETPSEPACVAGCGAGVWTARDTETHLLRLATPTDVLSWGNIGPGARRGMQRLGLPPTVKTMVKLWEQLHGEFEEFVWPFEVREIEHSLCEFDKYQRVLHNQGRPRGRFR